jgi:hypothetical protein
MKKESVFLDELVLKYRVLITTLDMLKIYYNSHFGLIKAMLGDAEAWGGGALGEQRAEAFLSSEIFTERFFRHMLGMYSCNNLTIVLEGPFKEAGGSNNIKVGATGLNRIYASMNHSCDPNIYANYKSGSGAEVNVYACCDIPVGGEICSTYLLSKPCAAMRENQQHQPHATAVRAARVAAG